MNPYERFIAGKDPMRVLAATHSQLVKLVLGLSPRQLAKRVVPEKWSIQEVIGHLADCEVVMAARCRWIAFEDNPTLLSFDQDLWAQGRLREAEPVAEALERFRVLRQSQLRFFNHLPASDLNRTAQHLERGKQYLREYAPLCAGHDVNHLEQIKALRDKLAPGKVRRAAAR